MLFVLYRGDEIDGAAIAAFSVVLFDEDAVCTVDFNDGLPDELPKADRVYIVGTGYDWPSIERVCADAKAVVLFEHGYKQHYLLDNIEQHLSRVDNIVIAYGRIEDQPGMGVVTSFIKFCEGSLCNPAKALLKRFRNEGLISLINDYSKGIRDDEINEFVTGLRLTADAKLADMPQLKPSKALIVVLGRLCVASLSLTQICDEGYKKIKESEQLEAAGRSSEQSLSEKEEGEEVNDDGTPMENTASSSSESILSVAMEENGSSRVVKHISPKDIPNFKRKQQQPFYNGPMNGKRKFQPPENGFMPPKKRYRNFYYYEKHSGPSSPPPTFFRKKKPFPKQKPHDYNDHRRPPPYHANRNHSLPYKRSPFWNRKPSPSTKKRFYHRRSNMTEESSAILLTGRDNQWGRHSPPPAFL